MYLFFSFVAYPLAVISKTSAVQQFFMCLLASFIPPFVKCMFKSCVIFLSYLFMCCDICSHSLSYLFVFLIVPFGIRKC